MTCPHCGSRSIYREYGETKCLMCSRTVDADPDPEPVVRYRKCIAGHEVTPENTVKLRDKRGSQWEKCRLCYEEEQRYASIVRDTKKGPSITIFPTRMEDWKRLTEQRDTRR